MCEDTIKTCAPQNKDEIILNCLSWSACCECNYVQKDYDLHFLIKWPLVQARVVIAALFKNLIVIRYRKANETADYCCIFGHFDLLCHGKLDSLCDTTTKLIVFVALQAFDNFLAHLSFSDCLSSVVCLSVCKLFLFSTCSQELLG